MNILQVIHNFLPEQVGGSQVYTRDLCMELARTHKVYLFYGSDHDSRPFKTGYYENLPVTSVPSHGDRYFTLRNSRIKNQFKKTVRRFCPDIIHFQHLIDLGMDLVDVGHELGIPMVYTLHDYWLICPDIHLMNRRSKICCRANRVKCARYFLETELCRLWETTHRHILDFYWRSLRNVFGISRFLIARSMAVRDMREKISLFIAPSRFVKRKFIEHGFREEKISYCPHGVKVDGVIRKSVSEKLRFGFINTPNRFKGLDLLLEAFDGAGDALLHIYGVWPEDRRDREAILSNPAITFKGEFSPEDRGLIFADFDVLVFPSRLYESCGLAVLEALWAKVPSIVSDSGAARELIENNKTGLLFEMGNAEDLKGKMKYLVDNPGEVERLSSNIGSVKTMSEHAAEIEAIYEYLLNSVHP